MKKISDPIAALDRRIEILEDRLTDTHDEIDAVLRELEALRDTNKSYIQVRFPGSLKNYTYEDPSGEVEVGDYVLAGYGSPSQVVALGHGGFKGQIYPIRARLEEVSV